MFKIRHSGFSLVELMTVIAIVAILAALAVPSFNEYFEKARLRGAADDVVALLAEARQNAVKQNRQVAISFGGAGNAWCMGANPAADPAAGARIPNAAACDCTTPASCGLRALSGGNYRGVTPSGVLPGTFRFDPKLGTRLDLQTSNFDLQSRSGRFTLRVNVNPTGQARVCRVSGSGVITGYRDC